MWPPIQIRLSILSEADINNQVLRFRTSPSSTKLKGRYQSTNTNPEVPDQLFDNIGEKFLPSQENNQEYLSTSDEYRDYLYEKLLKNERKIIDNLQQKKYSENWRCANCYNRSNKPSINLCSICEMCKICKVIKKKNLHWRCASCTACEFCNVCTKCKCIAIH